MHDEAARDPQEVVGGRLLQQCVRIGVSARSDDQKACSTPSPWWQSMSTYMTREPSSSVRCSSKMAKLMSLT